MCSSSAVVVRNHITHGSRWSVWPSVLEVLLWQEHSLVWELLSESGQACAKRLSECGLRPSRRGLVGEGDLVGGLEVLLILRESRAIASGPDRSYYSRLRY